MRFQPPLRPTGRALIWLALLLGAAPPSAHADDPPPPGVLMGTVVRAIDGAPVPFANIIVTSTRFATNSDESGRFLLASLPPGRLMIRVQALGGPPLLEEIDLAPGDTIRRVYRLEAPAHERFLHTRDSLSARGLWPPTLEPALHAHMQEAFDVRVFRLDPDHPVEDAPPDAERRIGPWPIVGEARPPERLVVDGLIETLGHSALYLPNIQGVKKLCAGFSPGIDVRFVSMGVAVDLLLCYTCGEFSIWRDGRARQAGDFEDRAPDFVRFAKRMFPDDPVIRRLGRRTATPNR